MQILRGTKREITMMQWNELLEKAEKRLADSEECYRRFGEQSDLDMVNEDKAKVAEIKANIKEVIAYMGKHGIK